MTKYLDAFYDEAAEYPEDWTIVAIANKEIDRLLTIEWTAQRAADKPRRLGGDATYTELSADRRSSRAVGHAAAMQRKAWQKEEGSYDGVVVACSAARKKELERVAATLHWDSWLDRIKGTIILRAQLVASWSIDKGERKFGNRAVSRYLAEIERLEWAVKL